MHTGKCSTKADIFNINKSFVLNFTKYKIQPIKEEGWVLPNSRHPYSEY